jgi:hypothetical protein
MHDDRDDETPARIGADGDSLGALVHERVPSAELRARTVSALRERDLLVPPASVRVRRRSAGMRRMLVYLTAASLVFAAGGVVGYRMAIGATRSASATAPRIAADVTPVRDARVPADPNRQVVWF